MSVHNKQFLGSLAGALIIILCQLPAIAHADSSEDTGDTLSWALPVVAFSATLFAGDKEGAIQMAKGLGTTHLATWLLKEAVNKTRPKDEDDPFHDGDNNSFPSGHASFAFQSAAFIHERYGWKYAVPAYLAATYVGHTRIDSDSHDEWDVLAGAALGIVSSFYFTTPYEKESIKVTPLVGHRTYGLRFSANF